MTQKKTFMSQNPNLSEIWLVRFPFSDLTSAKLRPALVLATHRDERIILGIFSKIPESALRESWVLVDANHPHFLETGLKKTSLIRSDKIATVSLSVFQNQLGHLPPDLLNAVHTALLSALNLNLLNG